MNAPKARKQPGLVKSAYKVFIRICWVLKANKKKNQVVHTAGKWHWKLQLIPTIFYFKVWNRNFKYSSVLSFSRKLSVYLFLTFIFYI